MTPLRNFTFRLGCRWSVLLLLVLSACRTVPPLPKLDLTRPGWTMLRGQAVWCPRQGNPGVAGEIMLATNLDGTTFVQFTKSPLPLAVAQETATGWQVEFPLQHLRYTGRGTPPARLVWFILPAAYSGVPVPSPWIWQRLDGDSWHLQNSRSGESLEGFFSQ